MILPGETEAGTAGGRNHAEGYPGGLIETMNGGVRARSCAAQPPSDRKTSCLENPRPRGGILTNGERRFSWIENPDDTHRAFASWELAGSMRSGELSVSESLADHS